MKEYFKRLGLGFDEEKQEVIAPTWRPDLMCTADLAEEVARMYGYDKIPTTLPKGETTVGGISFKLEVEEKARETAQFCGFSQSMTYSFESPKVFDKLLIPKDDELRQAITIMNPLGEDFSIMRTTPLNGMLTSLSTNYNRRNKNVKLYELANTYRPKQLPLTELPDERIELTFGFYGSGDFYTMKGVIEEIFEELGMNKRVHYNSDCAHPYLHPGRRADIVYDNVVVGYLGEVHPQVAENYRIGERAYIGVLDMPSLMPFVSFDHRFTGVPRFPAVTRDLSMVVPKDIEVGKIEDMIVQRGGKILEECHLFDVYEGEQIKGDYKSVAYSLTFRSKDHTLTEDEINSAMKKILNGLDRMGIKLRG